MIEFKECMELLDLFVSSLSKSLKEDGLAITTDNILNLYSSDELALAKLKHDFNDVKMTKGTHFICFYLSDTIDLDYYQELINNSGRRSKIKKEEVVPLLIDFNKEAKKNNTNIETEIKEFYKNYFN